ncbi:hypothetical protein [Piscinibacter sakaiensis]|uniref:hypothetical protein n=1 Tax=Piscinibacter sakaiensis TaxID=1547922 RepID=UPI003AAB60BE
MFGLSAVVALVGGSIAAPAIAPLPQSLFDTGLYAGRSADAVRRTVLPFTPQYGLWSDAARKRRWIWLPPGTSIDASRPDAWEFPRGTRLWKEFSVAGRPVETRFIERLANGDWRYAAYVWTADGSDALLAKALRPTLLSVDGAPGGKYQVPSQADCRACHEGAAVPVLGFSALQLSADRDPNALHVSAPDLAAVDLRALVARGWLRGLPQRLLDEPPRIAANTPSERAALGYLHANCGHCHNDADSRAPVKLLLAQTTADAHASRERVLGSLLGADARFRKAGQVGSAALVAPGDAAASVLLQRMRTRNPLQQMPPIGTRLADSDAIDLIARWIESQPTSTKEKTP